MKFYERMFNLLQEELGNLINTLDLLEDEDFIKIMILSTANQIKIAGDMFDIVREEEEEEELTEEELNDMKADMYYEQKQEEKLFN